MECSLDLLYVYAKTSLYFQSFSNSNTFSGCNLKFTFTICGSSLVPKLRLVNYYSLLTSNRLSLTLETWSLLRFHISEHSLVGVCSMFLNTLFFSKKTISSYLFVVSPSTEIDVVLFNYLLCILISILLWLDFVVLTN